MHACGLSDLPNILALFYLVSYFGGVSVEGIVKAEI